MSLDNRKIVNDLKVYATQGSKLHYKESKMYHVKLTDFLKRFALYKLKESSNKVLNSVL